ncbi:MAG: hypothetical protein JSS87_01900 [Acidobacteria bacterium]|nr:hypothetical protein [Acidobacteriota bacterium]
MAIVLGYHGCDQATAQKLLSGSSFVESNQPWDWLGSGAYFWEWDAVRAYTWALERRSNAPCIVGAAIDLGHCLDLTTQSGILAVAAAYRSYKELQEQAGKALPQNRPKRNDQNPKDRALRFLDKAVIEHLHQSFKEASLQRGTPYQEFQTVRALFPEGEELYENAGFLSRTHVQIAVRVPAQIRGVFRIPVDECKKVDIPIEIYDFGC